MRRPNGPPMRALDSARRKMLAHRLDWDGIDRKKALSTPRVLDLLRQACLVESYLPVYTGKMMALFWDDLDATAIFTIEAAEAYGHYAILRRYLDVVGYRPITDREVVALRRKERAATYTDPIRELVNFMGTEHFAAHFFTEIRELTDEPAIRQILPEFAAEERIHSRFAFDLLAARLAKDPRKRAAVVRHASAFRHVGTYVIDEVRPAGKDNARAIQSLNRKFGQLLGAPLSDLLVSRAR